MKIREITEAPFSGILAKNKAMQAKMLAKVPGSASKARAANMTARADMKATANNLYTKFSSHMGGQGKKVAQASAEDLKAFFKTMNYQGVTARGPLDKATLNSELTKAAKHAMKGNLTTGKPHTGGKVKGKVSQTPNAQRKRAARAAQRAKDMGHDQALCSL